MAETQDRTTCKKELVMFGETPWWMYLAVVVAGVLAGFINTLAGSGSAITLPVLIWLGLPANVANGTNRVGVLLQSLTSTSTFTQEKVMDWPGFAMLALPTVAGAIWGAQIAVELDERAMNIAIGIMLVITFFVIIADPKKWLKQATTHDKPNWQPVVDYFVARLQGQGAEVVFPGWGMVARFLGFGVLFFAIGVYGGFIQAGVGIFLLVGLVLGSGYTLVRGNALKGALVTFFTIFALVVFIINGQVNWALGIILGLGNIVGAWVAARIAVKEWAQVWVYRLLLGVVVFAAAQTFWEVFGGG